MAETLLTAWTSAAHLIVVGWVALAHADLMIVAVAYLVSRTLYTVLAVIGAERLFDGLKLRAEPLSAVWRSVKAGWGWAADSGLSYLNGQIDGLLVVTIFGLQAAGVYRAGAPLCSGGLGCGGCSIQRSYPALGI
jgi:O-antigen/teichoic acid export membrane protein